MGQYVIEGENGVWEIVSSYEESDTIVVVFQNIGSGTFLELDICPFEYLINDKISFGKWDL